MIASSETTREPPLSSFNFTDFVEHHLVEHKKLVNPAFLEWFVGFVEGDGTFCSREIPPYQPTPAVRGVGTPASQSGPSQPPRSYIFIKNVKGVANEPPFYFSQKCVNKGARKRRFLFQVCQKDPKVLYKIREELGFGAVRQSGNEEARHWRYTVEDRRGLQRIMALFNGNLVLPKRRRQFANWICDAREILWPSFALSDTGPVVSLDTGWLSGFIDAEGCFYAAFTTPSLRYTVSYRLAQKMHITQRDEYGEREVLGRIGLLLQSKATVRLVKPPDCYRIEMCSVESHQVLIEYLKHFPLQSKAIPFRQWWRVYLLRVKGRHLNETGIRRMRRLCSTISAQQSRKRKGMEGSG